MTTGLGLFDANCIVGAPSRRTPMTLTGESSLLEEMDRFGIEAALITHVHAIEHGVDEGNRKTLSAAKSSPRFSPAISIPLHAALEYTDPVGYVISALGEGARAVRVSAPPFHGDVIARWALGALWAVLEAHRLPVLLSRTALSLYPGEQPAGISPEGVHEIAARFPDLPIVLLRVNFSSLRVLIPLMQECPNLIAELSFFTSHNGISALVDSVGSDRILFGSGWPWISPGPAIAAIRYSGLDTEDQKAISGENLRQLLSAVIVEADQVSAKQ